MTVLDRRQLGQRCATVLVTMLRKKQVNGGEMAILRSGARHISVPVRLRDPASDLRKATSISQELAHAASTENVIITQRMVDGLSWIIYMFQLPKACWETYTRADLTDTRGSTAIGVGLAERKRQVDVDFSRSAHLLIVGSSQVSGKSTAMRSLLTGLASTHTPRELQIIIVDPAGDTSRGLERAEHLVLPPAETPEQAALAIDRMSEEKRRRESIRYRAGGGLPMYLLAIDEAQNIIPEAGRQAELAKLGEQIGKLDMHLMIATQKPLEETLPGLTFNLSARLVGQVPTSRDAALLTGRRSEEAPAHKLTIGGDFLLVQGGAEVERVQAAEATDQDLRHVPINGTCAWPGLDEDNVPQHFEPEPPNQGGRPRVKVNPVLIARYMWAGWHGQSITELQARQAFNVARTGHERNRSFAALCAAELKRLTHA